VLNEWLAVAQAIQMQNAVRYPRRTKNETGLHFLEQFYVQ
jgi:hypothetical protein